MALTMSESDDSEMEWEEIVPSEQAISLPRPSTVDAPLEIVIQAPAPAPGPSGLRKEKTQADQLARVTRLAAHRFHTLALLANASIRNRWLNDTLLQARLMSLTPLAIQTSFAMITRRNQPDKGLRGRQFEAALVRLAEWWAEKFRVAHEKGIRHQPYEAAQALLPRTSQITTNDPKGKGKARRQNSGEEEDTLFEGGEKIRSVNSLMKHALMMRGSPDMSAQLFTALCRSLGLPTRLVVSIQAVLWRKEKTHKERALDKAIQHSRRSMKEKEQLRREAALTAAAARNASGKYRASGVGHTVDERFSESTASSPKSRAPEQGLADMSSPSTSADPGSSVPAAGVTLRRSRPQGRLLGETRSQPYHSSKRNSPPVFWTEVYSRPDGRWLCVNPIAANVDKSRTFEPTSGDEFNHMLYVVAFEEDGFVRDVTPRYARNFATKIMKARSSGDKPEWWNIVLSFLTRTYRLHRDDVEDAEFETLQAIEGMPTTMGAFKNHPLYALERHLRHDEVIYPRSEIGKFRGEPVFGRHSVTQVKSAENWLRSSGGVIRPGAQPLKMGKVRANTLNKRRAVEMAAADASRNTGEDSAMTQGLYAEWQTEPYVPDPVVKGKVPKNEFGNIDLYVPSMLPTGAAHLPFKGIVKIARQLGIDYAEAVTGFEFRQRRAFPVFTGVVVPIEREAELIEAYEASAQAAEEKERRKKEERVIKLWTKIIRGLRIRDRLKSQYAEGTTQVLLPDANSDEEGGYINEADAHAGLESLGSRVTRFELPTMNMSAPIENPLQSPLVLMATSEDEELEEIPPSRQIILQGEADTAQHNSDIPPTPGAEVRRINMRPKTMTEFAATRRQIDNASSAASGSDGEPSSISAAERSSIVKKQAPKATTPSRMTRSRQHPTTATSLKRRRRNTSASVGSGGEDGDFDLHDEKPSTPRQRSTRSKRSAAVSQVLPKSDRVLRTRSARQSFPA